VKITTNVKGQLAVSKAEIRAYELGFVPCRPLFDTRYDLIIDDFKSLRRIQVKYADAVPSSGPGTVSVKLEYIDRQKKFHTYSRQEVDALIVYIPKIDKLCYFPLKVFEGKRRLSVRLEQAKSGQSKRIIYAKDYFW